MTPNTHCQQFLYIVYNADIILLFHQVIPRQILNTLIDGILGPHAVERVLKRSMRADGIMIITGPIPTMLFKPLQAALT